VLAQYRVRFYLTTNDMSKKRSGLRMAFVYTNGSIEHPIVLAQYRVRFYLTTNGMSKEQSGLRIRFDYVYVVNYINMVLFDLFLYHFMFSCYGMSSFFMIK